MEIIHATTPDQFLPQYQTLLERLYHEFPRLVQERSSEIRRSLNHENPFFQIGSVQSLAAIDQGEMIGYATAIIDPRLPGATGLIGFYEAIQHPSAGILLLKAAQEHLGAKGCVRICGPVNLTTWQTFRLVTQPSPLEPFPHEPYTPSRYADTWRNSGFRIAQENVSYSIPLPVAPESQRAAAHGYTIHPLTRESTQEIREIHRLTVAAFADTWNFVPISAEEFLFMSSTTSAALDDPLILVAQSPQGEAVGYVLAYPHQPSRGPFSIVIKTIAVDPLHRRRGVGSALFAAVCDRARLLRAERAILSTIRVGNDPIQHMVVPHGATPDRTYAVYERKL